MAYKIVAAYIAVFLISVSIGNVIQQNIPEDEDRKETDDFKDVTEDTRTTSKNQTPAGTNYWFAYDISMRQGPFKKKYPSANFIGTAKLEDSRLDFTDTSDKFSGGVATVCRMCGSTVYGALYEVDDDDYNLLVRKNAVFKLGTKKVVSTFITLVDNDKVIVSSFLTEIACPKPILYGLPLPADRLPSRTYLKELLHACLDADIPDHYVRSIAAIGDNGLTADKFPTTKQQSVEEQEPVFENMK